MKTPTLLALSLLIAVSFSRRYGRNERLLRNQERGYVTRNAYDDSNSNSNSMWRSMEMDEDSDLEGRDEQHSQNAQDEVGDEEDPNVHITIIKHQTNNIAHHGDFHLLHGMPLGTEQLEESYDDDETVSDEEAACGKIADANGDGQITGAEKRAFINCLKGARGGFDADGDGEVTEQEMRCGLQSDTNNNGKIDASEVAEFEQCLGIRGKEHLGPEHNKPVSKAEMACTKIADADGDGMISADEKKAFIACLKGAKGGYDGDKDKTVSPKELRCGFEADKDKNGVLDKQEIAAFEECLGIKPKAKAGAKPKKGAKPAKGAAKPKVPLKPKAKVPLKTPAKPAAPKPHGYDMDGNGVVTAEEQACGMIADSNGDGHITGAEKRAMIQCLKGAKLDYDANHDQVLTVRELRCAMKADVNKDGKLDSKEIIVFETCLGLRTQKLGYDADNDGKVSPEEQACGKIVDTDHNGRIDKTETKAFIACLKGAKGGYDGNKDTSVSAAELRCGVSADANMNGHLDADEMAAFKKCLAAADKGAKVSPPAQRPTQAEYRKAKEALDALDFDGDGKVSEKERKFGMKYDADKNGKLDAAERVKARAAWAKEQAKQRLKAKKALSGMDFNGDGKVSEREKAFGKNFDCDENGKLDKEERKRAARAWALARYAKKKAEKKAGAGFKGLDLDGDGKISDEERQFGMKFDANKNGKLDKDEMVKAAKAWAEKRAIALKKAQGKIAKMQAKLKGSAASAREAEYDDEYAYAEEYYGDDDEEEDYGYGYFDDEYDDEYGDEYYGDYYDDEEYYGDEYYDEEDYDDGYYEDYADYDDFEYAEDDSAEEYYY